MNTVCFLVAVFLSYLQFLLSKTSLFQTPTLAYVAVNVLMQLIPMPHLELDTSRAAIRVASHTGSELRLLFQVPRRGRGGVERFFQDSTSPKRSTKKTPKLYGSI
jgi:hypothetical protein